MNNLKPIPLAILIGLWLVGSHLQLSAVQDVGQKQAAQAQAQAKTDGAGRSFSIQLNGGKLVVVDQDGTEREIDVGNAKSIIVRQSAQSKVVDGQQVETKVAGKAIIVGPDGAVQEIEIGDGNMGQFKVEIPDLEVPMNLLPELPRHMQRLFSDAGLPKEIAPSKYFIGVHCEKVDDPLRSHLQIEAGRGLIIKEIVPDSPAAKAGLRPHDVLLYAGQKPLADVTELVQVINDAGAEGLIVELGILRGGKEMTLQVTPEERPAVAQIEQALPEGALPEGVPGVPGVMRILPGLIRAYEGQAIDETIQNFQQQVDELRQRTKTLTDEFNNEHFREQMKQLREEMREAHEEFRKAREEMLKSLQEMKRSVPPTREGGGF